MSTVERPRVLPLAQGQRLKQPEFHQPYEAMPEGAWVELIGGEALLSSPVVNRPGVVFGPAVTWLNLYRFRKRGVQVGENNSTILNDENEVQADALMRILPDRGGQATIVDRMIPGAPDPDGLDRSKVFPGLWLDPVAFFEDVGPRVVAAHERGLAPPEHLEFTAELESKKDPRT